MNKKIKYQVIENVVIDKQIQSQYVIVEFDSFLHAYETVYNFNMYARKSNLDLPIRCYYTVKEIFV